MSSAETRSPGWSRGSEPIADPRKPEAVKTITPEPPTPPEPLAFEKEETLEEPAVGPSIALADAKADYEEAMARAKAEFEEAMRSIAREQEQLKRRVKELEIANADQEATLEESEGEPSTALAEAKADYEEALAKVIAEYEESIRLMARAQEELERRIRELEAAQTAQEDATRAIIRDTTSTLGSKINQAVTFGGDFEVLAGRFTGSSGMSESLVELSTAEIDFEIQVNDWTLGSLIFEYIDGTTTLLQTISGQPEGVDRVNIDTAFLTIGNLQRFPLAGTFGQVIVPFGISTGDPVADVLTLEDPLTIEVFEMREIAVQIDVGFPTPPLTPATPPVVPPRVKPLVINPLFKLIGKGLGYDPPPTRPVQPTPMTPSPAPPLFNVGFVVFQGNTFTGSGTEGGFNFSATAGFRKKWDCHRPYEERLAAGWRRLSCPWSIDVDIDFNSSVFDSRFLELEYGSFLPQIGSVPGMASSVKATLGALSLVGEWNGAIEEATFVDDSGTLISMTPSAWQVSLGYQFDWNPWVEAIGAQGDYIAASYSVSDDLAGVTLSGERVGFAPRRRFSLSAGEWVMDGLRLAVEYSYSLDYPPSRGGTGSSINSISSAITYSW
jgi:uncharacterized coiled-coil protein SlyX